jgi:hypothetical protein
LISPEPKLAANCVQSGLTRTETMADGSVPSPEAAPAPAALAANGTTSASIRPRSSLEYTYTLPTDVLHKTTAHDA